MMEQTERSPKRVIALHDMSSFGRCALSVIMPVLSVMRAQVCAVPTALHSTHTGGFDEFYFEETTRFMQQTLRHFQKLGLHFDAVYSGFLGNEDQIDVVEEYLRAYPRAIRLVDPVMGDDGKLYATCTPRLCARMRRLTEQADMITPNLTEAALLLDEPYCPAPEEETLREWVRRLSNGGQRSVVITGALKDGGVQNVGFDRVNGEYFTVRSDLLHAEFPGTGDIFASVLLGAALRGAPFSVCVKEAAAFVCECIRITQATPQERRNGVSLEFALDWLARENAKL